MRFKALSLALYVIKLLAKRLRPIRKHDGKLANQIRDAANSVILNLAEGNRRNGRDRLHLWNIAAGSADEVRVGPVMQGFGPPSAGDTSARKLSPRNSNASTTSWRYSGNSRIERFCARRVSRATGAFF